MSRFTGLSKTNINYAVSAFLVHYYTDANMSTQSGGRSRKSTSTSSFGTSGRVSHDSSKFYHSRLYESLPNAGKVEYLENPVPASTVNRLLCKSSEQMHELPDASVHLMVTSPPYNVGKEYDEDLSLSEYLAFLRTVWREVHRVLVPGGRACVNVASLGRSPYLPIHAYVAMDMIDLGFLMRGEIIWQKGSSAGSSTAWGSWMSPSNPTLRDTHEYILVFSKMAFRRPSVATGEGSISRDEFLAYTKSVWEFPAVSAKRIGHPAPFPVDLPYRLIQLYTYRDDIVLDPFMGSGQTAVAALRTGRRYVGYEVDEEYVRLSQARVSDFEVKHLSPTLFDLAESDDL